LIYCQKIDNNIFQRNIIEMRLTVFIPAFFLTRVVCYNPPPKTIDGIRQYEKFNNILLERDYWNNGEVDWWDVVPHDEVPIKNEITQEEILNHGPSSILSMATVSGIIKALYVDKYKKDAWMSEIIWCLDNNHNKPLTPFNLLLVVYITLVGFVYNINKSEEIKAVILCEERGNNIESYMKLKKTATAVILVMMTVFTRNVYAAE